MKRLGFCAYGRLNGSAEAGTGVTAVTERTRAANDALDNGKVRTALKRQGTGPLDSAPKEFADFTLADIENRVAVLAGAAQGT